MIFDWKRASCSMETTLLVSSRGTGAGVAVFSVTLSSGITLTLSGTARFYSDTAGTLNESTTWSSTGAGTNTRYVKCTSGTSTLTFSDYTKVTGFGTHGPNVTNTTACWGHASGSTYADVPSLDFSNWNFPNCTQVAMTYSGLNVYNGSVATLFGSGVLTKAYMASTGTLTGSLSDLNNCQFFLCSPSINSMSGDISGIPDSMVQFYITNGGVWTGDIGTLPSGMTYFGMYSTTNTLSGDIADLPSSLLSLSITGLNTVHGDIADFPASMTDVNITGLNTLVGDIVDLPSTLTAVTIWGNNTQQITGDVADLPPNIASFSCYGNNSVYGDVADIPNSCVLLKLSGVNTLSGDVADLPTSMGTLEVGGSNTLHGDVTDIPKTVYYLSISGSNTITGDLVNLPTIIQFISLSGLNTVYGDIATLGSSLYSATITGNNTISNYTHKTWSQAGYVLTLYPSGVGGLSASEVDQLFIDINTDCTFSSPSYRTIILLGTNAAPTATSLTARNALIAKGVSITTN